MNRSLEDYQGEVFQLYIVMNKTARDVIETLKRDHHITVTPKILKTKLGYWGYSKNVKRSDVVQILRERARSPTESNSNNGFTFSWKQRPANYERIERHKRRARLTNDCSRHYSGKHESLSTAHLPQAPSPSLELQAAEEFLSNIDRLIKGSFEAGVWSFKSKDLLIRSSSKQSLELRALHDFLGNFAMGTQAAADSSFDRAGLCWQKAFSQIKVLVRGQFHDIIPNIIQKINDLNRQGYGDLALLLKSYVARLSKCYLVPTCPIARTLSVLGTLDIVFLLEIEERVMRLFSTLFRFYLGHMCYNSFVMEIETARRRLLYDDQKSFNCLPKISESTIGPNYLRFIDLIGVRVEILTHRRMYVEAEHEASLLLQRAQSISDSEWHRLYNMTRGFYFLGTAQYFLRNREAAISSLSGGLQADDELCEIDSFHIFDTERMAMVQYLEHLKSNQWTVEELGGVLGTFKSSAGPMVFFRCCKEPLSTANHQS